MSIHQCPCGLPAGLTCRLPYTIICNKYQREIHINKGDLLCPQCRIEEFANQAEKVFQLGSSHGIDIIDVNWEEFFSLEEADQDEMVNAFKQLGFLQPLRDSHWIVLDKEMKVVTLDHREGFCSFKGCGEAKSLQQTIQASCTIKIELVV